MATVRMAYFDEAVDVEIPDRNLIDVLVPVDMHRHPDLAGCLEHHLEHPVGTQPFSELCKNRKKACIIVCDLTRPMETEKVLPTVIAKLEAASPGVDITLLVALGTHRPLSDAEIDKVVGKDIHAKYRVVNHDAWDDGCLATIPGGRDDFPVQVNSLLVECDLRIGIGAVKPHPIFGWSGGVKIVIPGVSGYETTGLSHWNSCPFKGVEIMGKVDNPVRAEAERIVVGANLLDFVVNAALTENSDIADLRCGHPVEAHREVVEIVKRYYFRDIPRPADAVLAGIGKWAADLWVGSMSVYQSEFFVKKGGTIVVFGKLPEGVSLTHPEILEWGYRPYREVDRLVKEGKLSGDLTLAAHLVHLGRVLDAREARCLLVSDGISRDDAAKLGFDYAESPAEVMDYLFARHGPDCDILALPGFNSTVIVSEHPAV